MLGVLTSAGDPTSDGGFGEGKDAGSGLRTETFRDRVQHLGDACRR